MDNPEPDYIDLIKTYIRDGAVVIPQVLTPEEVTICREGLHQDLLSVGVDYNDLANSLEALKRFQTHQSGGLPFHYSPWRLRYCACNEKLFKVTQALWKSTWAISAPGFECPHAPFLSESGYSLIDSMNFRLPSTFIEPVRSSDKLQKNLAPHIDINPWDKWGGKKGRTRWRPFQGLFFFCFMFFKLSSFSHWLFCFFLHSSFSFFSLSFDLDFSTSLFFSFRSFLFRSLWFCCSLFFSFSRKKRNKRK